VLLLRVTSMSKGINFTPFLPAESTLQPEGLLHTRGMLPILDTAIDCPHMGSSLLDPVVQSKEEADPHALALW